MIIEWLYTGENQIINNALNLWSTKCFKMVERTCTLHFIIQKRRNKNTFKTFELKFEIKFAVVA